MNIELPKLPYATDALEPFIGKSTIEFHYGKHHQAYVNNLNGLIKGTPFENAELEEIVKKAEGSIFNNAAQVWNHSFYFFQFCKNGIHEPTGDLKDAINHSFGSFVAFQELFTKASIGLFGSGWVWLVVEEKGKLEIVQTQNAQTPITSHKTPLLTCDVWEHAYYLDKQNLRAKYVEDFWKIIDWNVISERFEKCKK